MWNRINKITPATIKKEIYEIIDGLHLEDRAQSAKLKGRRTAVVNKNRTNMASKSPAKLSRALNRLEKTMYGHARDLEFEQAAIVRDEILELKRQYFGEAAVAKLTAVTDRS